MRQKLKLRSTEKKLLSETLTTRNPITRYEPEPTAGLTSAEAETRIANGWDNRPVKAASKTIGDIIRENLLTYFNLIFAIIAGLLIMVGAFRDLTFLPIIIFNTLIGIVQEVRSKKVLDNLSMLNAPKVKAVRDSKITEIASELAVIDDIVLLEAGNQICADAELLTGSVQVNESLLTGEQDEITKTPGDTLMSGSFIISGSCYARLTKVGADSYISKLTLEAKAINNKEQSEMIRSLNRLVKAVGIIILPLSAILFVQNYFFHDIGLRSSVTAMVAAIIGMIPEGLYLLASVALAVSSMRLASKKVLLHDMKSIETLARVDVLCVDKTGTITENAMSVNEVIPAPGYDPGTMESLDALIGSFVYAMSADNITMEALKKHFKQGKFKPVVGKIPFSSARKYSSVTFQDLSYILGAPENVLRDDYDRYSPDILPFAEQGCRVLVFGSCEAQPGEEGLNGAVTPLAYITLSNAIRPEARDTFQYFADQGVAVKVISGDNPVTVSRVAIEAGIADADQFVDASTLRTDREIEQAILTYTVFGRVTPDQKRKFVQALKENGKTVAMTGDGVNDVLALKDADCSIAMASGSQAATQAAQLVLLDNNFSCMTSVVGEGRRVVNNIERSASLFLVKNIFSFLLAIVSLLFGFSYPLEPSQVSLISMFNIGVPAFFLALLPNKNIIKGHFLSNVVARALPAGITDVLVVSSLVLFGQIFEVNPTDISTAATLLLAIVGFMILYRICKPMNRLKWAIWGMCIAGLLGCSIFLGDLFALTGMSQKCIMLFGVFSIVTEPVLRYLSMLVEYFYTLASRVKKKILARRY